jgi:hypothetical protein
MLSPAKFPFSFHSFQGVLLTNILSIKNPTSIIAEISYTFGWCYHQLNFFLGSTRLKFHYLTTIFQAKIPSPYLQSLASNNILLNLISTAIKQIAF